MVDFNQALRPSFTETVYRHLVKGETVHVLALEGQGVERLLTDIKPQAQAAGNLVIEVDFKGFVKDFKGFLRHVWQQIPKEQRGVEPATFSVLMGYLEGITQQKWLFFHHFDTLFDNIEVDSLYNRDFISGMNGLRNNIAVQVALLVVTYKRLNECTFFVDKQPQEASQFTFTQALTLPRLGQFEIEAELQREGDTLARYELTQMREAIYQHSHSYDFLHFVLQKMLAKEGAERRIEENLQRWEREYKTQSLLTQRRSMGWRKWIVRWLAEGRRWLLLPVVGSLLYGLGQWVVSLFTKKP